MDDATQKLPKRGETWKWEWLSVVITSAGPKRITYRVTSNDVRTNGRTGWVETDRFLRRFHKTGL